MISQIGIEKRGGIGFNGLFPIIVFQIQSLIALELRAPIVRALIQDFIDMLVIGSMPASRYFRAVGRETPALSAPLVEKNQNWI
ncbi:MAG: hypothetical protein PHV34_24705 [Verrucomicrobiae bacterium]|nr:hypothetical protein [Verrucomicrobiae bacterium]